jgi:hypothetical protein
MRLARAPMMALPHDDAVSRNDDGADEWIRARPSPPAPRMEQRAFHVIDVSHEIE